MTDRSRDTTLADRALLDAVSREAAALASAARLDLDATVPGCPDWSVVDLVDHVSGIHLWASGLCNAAPDRIRRRDVPARDHGTDAVVWFEQCVEQSLALLATADLEVPTQTWAGEQDRRWWLRRLANETAMHRWDAQSSTGSPAPIDPSLAADGIDEVLDWFAPLLLDRSTLTSPATLHLHATDDVPGHPGEWFVEVGPEALTWDHRHEKGDIAVRGSASDLLLTMWARVDDSVEVLGDDELLDRVVTAMTA